MDSQKTNEESLPKSEKELPSNIIDLILSDDLEKDSKLEIEETIIYIYDVVRQILKHINSKEWNQDNIMQSLQMRSVLYRKITSKNVDAIRR